MVSYFTDVIICGILIVSIFGKETPMRSLDWNSFVIMHRNERVATVDCTGGCVIHNAKFMPFNLYLIENASDMRSRLNNLDNFYYWCSSRVLTLDRKYAKEILNSLGKKQAVTDRDRADIAISYHGLSMTDVYWVQGENENLNFDEINLYSNSLANSFVDVALCGKQLTAQNSQLIDDREVAGDVGTSGIAPKAWVRKQDGIYLYKDGNLRDVNAELIASKIIDCFDVEHIRYTADEYDGKKVTSCRLMTSVNESIVPMEYVEIFAANNDLDKIDLALKYDRYGYYMMNIVDYLVGNTDRHWGNWGFAVNNNDNSIIKLHALMDFNKAFNSYDTVDGAKCQTVLLNMSQKQAAVEAVKKVGLNQICEVARAWFDNDEIYEMFNKRLSVLKNALL